ncbi:metal ABC transporter permease [Sulfurimonas autotrophica]|uniref:ABC-3 protein n=1 Tax=Sulfurimonas autotrophica (strain ATCC BAA-671 / DSM 16294 / JCM 11897 / OK10) TaxID=563040 RepID=E0UST7_SULAO|nr:metal ABC transporter permease [Sulfurimonas autotrophica]ADN08114.1 ABC-3 protein [Sulfurimonas autotrophica DSM 16294]
MSIVELLWPAFVLAIALVFIHSIFGLEIIKRGVIFTDLAIGQIAAIGMALSVAFMDSQYQNIMTLLFALLAAAIITWATKKVQKIEAFIGLLYALGISSIMLILAQSAEGTELFSKLSAADILFTSSDDLLKSLLLYGGVAFVMFIVYPRLSGVKKEFLFFVMLALTVTSSVQSAGVLVVFALLIAPSYAGLAQMKMNALLFACLFGSLSIILALFGSYYLDLPTGYAIIFVTVLFSLVFVIVSSIIKETQAKVNNEE